ncbi:MAG: hypothetical protein P8P27_03395 [Flavobacteriaceae bacterium]|jgi:hypothetical protein|nr:hypothetical protein [Flavobacteriaceae bacterium]|tara:strand:+ start:8560 stop:9126 length:567 start_codon:yes stop_codon:yes gene_type:complete
MIKKIFLTGLVIFLFVQCTKERNPFLISNKAVGNLTIGMKIKQVDSIFAMDSIVRLSPRQNQSSSFGELEIYEKSGKKLLLISPANNYDPDALIENFQFFDDRYKTVKGLNINSTFKDIKENYEIANIETTLSTVLIILKDSDLFINIDKKELPENFRYNPNLVIDATNIPNEAKIKYFMLSWKIDDL